MVQRLQGGSARTLMRARRHRALLEGRPEPRPPAPRQAPPVLPRARFSPHHRWTAKAMPAWGEVEGSGRGRGRAAAAGQSLPDVQSAQTGQAFDRRFLLDDTLPPRGTLCARHRPRARDDAGAGRDVFSRPREGATGGGVSVGVHQAGHDLLVHRQPHVRGQGRPGAHPWLVMVIRKWCLILTDKEREITFMQAADEPVFVEPSHLLARNPPASLRPPRRRRARARGGGPGGVRHAGSRWRASRRP